MWLEKTSLIQQPVIETPCTMIHCLVQFYQDLDWRDFRFAELDALLEMNGVSPAMAYTAHAPLSPAEKQQSLVMPYLLLDLPSREVAVRICQRSVLIKHIYLVLGGKAV